MLIPVLLVSCLTTNSNINSYDLRKSILSKNDSNIENSNAIETFATYGQAISDIPALLNINNQKFDINISANDLKNDWKIRSKSELVDKIDHYYYNGITNEYIDTLRLFLTKPKLLAKPDELIKKENWSNDISSDKISNKKLWQIYYIAKNGKYLTKNDARIFDLVTVSYLTRMGSAAGFLSKDESNTIYEKIAEEITYFKGDWYELCRSYVAGIAYNYKDKKEMNAKIYQTVMASYNLLENSRWNKLPLKTL